MDARIAILRRSCSAYLLDRPDPELPELCSEAAFRPARQTIAANRLWRAVERGIVRSGGQLPRVAASEFRAARAQAMMGNLRLVELARHAVGSLEAAGIRAVVFKGPFLNRQLHGDPFFRRSSDLDLLVSRKQFREAIHVLEKDGFLSRREAVSRWWVHGLGEVHLRHRTGGTIDLHHRVQQPGCPLARRPVDFLRAVPQLHEVDGTKIPTLRPRIALALSALNLLKGLMKRQPSGHYALDVAGGALALDEAELAQLGEFAHRQGLLQSMKLALATAAKTFDVHLPLPAILRSDAGAALALHPDWPVETMVLEPDRAGLDLPRRRRLLWAMSEGSQPFARAANFTRDAVQALASETLRMITNPDPPARVRVDQPT